jgi:CMP-N-acetylneuraminic acid synthetase
MLGNLSILAVVPARGGSKGIPLKNLRQVGGRSLIAHVGAVVAATPEIDRAIVSTDHDGIAEEAQSAGIAAPFRRPEALSGDRIGDYDVLLNALNEIEALDGRRYDIVVMLQPTSPLRTAGQVSATIRMLVDGNWDAVWTVSTTDSKSHPFKQLTVGPDDSLGYFDQRGKEVIARQQLSPVYHRNGIAYAVRRECLVEQGTINGARTGALVVPEPTISIDTEWDLWMASLLLAERQR